jgi:hypothetical protein
VSKVRPIQVNPCFCAAFEKKGNEDFSDMEGMIGRVRKQAIHLLDGMF